MILRKVAFFSVFFLFTIWFLPASFLTPLFHHFHVPLSIRNSSGTIWKGQGQLFLDSPQNKNAPVLLLDQASWHTGISSLLSRGVSLRLEAPGLSPLSLFFSPSGFSIDPFHLVLDVSFLHFINESLRNFSLDGVASFQSSGILISSRAVSGDLSGNVHLVSSSLVPSINVLGNYFFHAEGQGKKVSFSFSSQEANVLFLEGQGTLDLNKRKFSWNGFARSRKDAPNSIAQFLELVGRRDGKRTIVSGDFSW